MRFIAIAAHNLQRRPMRSSLTALGAAMAVGCVLAMTGISRSLDHGWGQHLHGPRHPPAGRAQGFRGNVHRRPPRDGGATGSRPWKASAP